MNRYFGLHTLEGEWHALLPRYLFMADRIRGRRVLDIGCGSGLGSSLVLELGAAHVDAIDHRPEVLELARMKHDKEGIDFHVMLLEEFDFADDAFDVILCLDPSSPVTDPNLLREVKRVLAPGGQYICAIERKTVQGLEALLPRYGYSQAAEEVDLNQPGQRVPQIGELSNRFAHVRSIVQRPLYSFVFDTPGDGTPPQAPPPDAKPRATESDDAPTSEGLVPDVEPGDAGRWVSLDRTFSTNEADIGGVEIWFCADQPIDAPQLREVRLPYYSVIDRLRMMLHELHTQQAPQSQHDANLFAEVVDPEGALEQPFEDPESALKTGTWRAWGDMDEQTTQVRKLMQNETTGQYVPPRGRGDLQLEQLDAHLNELDGIHRRIKTDFERLFYETRAIFESREGSMARAIAALSAPTELAHARRQVTDLEERVAQLVAERDAMQRALDAAQSSGDDALTEVYERPDDGEEDDPVSVPDAIERHVEEPPPAGLDPITDARDDDDDDAADDDASSQPDVDDDRDTGEFRGTKDDDDADEVSEDRGEGEETEEEAPE